MFNPHNHIEEYLNNELNEKDTILFEKALEDDFDLQEALMEASEMNILLTNSAQSVGVKVVQMKKKQPNYWVVGIAASLLIVFGTGYFIIQEKNREQAALAEIELRKKAEQDSLIAYEELIKQNKYADSLKNSVASNPIKNIWKKDNWKPSDKDIKNHLDLSSGNTNNEINVPKINIRTLFKNDEEYRKNQFSSKFSLAGENDWHEEYDKGNYEKAKYLLEEKLKKFKTEDNYPKSECYYLGKICLYSNNPDYENAVKFLKKSETFRSDGKRHLLTALLLSERFWEAKEYDKNNPDVKKQLPEYLQKEL